MDDLTFHLGFKKEEETVRVFIVVVLTEFQSHLMQKFANKGICCDCILGTTGKRTIRIYCVCKQIFYISRACISQKVKVFPFEN